MTMLLTPSAAPAPRTKPWPPEVDIILSALAVYQPPEPKPRQQQRNDYRVRAALRLFADETGAPPWTVFTRDVDARGLGFITPHRLPLGYGGVLEIAAPDALPMKIGCTLFRCREVAPGWYEGSLCFNRPQSAFDRSAG